MKFKTKSIAEEISTFDKRTMKEKVKMINKTTAKLQKKLIEEARVNKGCVVCSSYRKENFKTNKFANKIGNDIKPKINYDEIWSRADFKDAVAPIRVEPTPTWLKVVLGVGLVVLFMFAMYSDSQALSWGFIH